MQGAQATSQAGPAQASAGSYQQQAYGAYQAPSGAFLFHFFLIFSFVSVIFCWFCSEFVFFKDIMVGSLKVAFLAMSSRAVTASQLMVMELQPQLLHRQIRKIKLLICKYTFFYLSFII